MNPFSEPLPGLLDDPLAQIQDLPDQPFHIAPLRDPRPIRAPTVPLLLEPSAANRREEHNIKNTTKLPARGHGTKSAEPVHTERTVKPTDINSLIDPIPVETPPKAPLPSFVSLAAVENKAPPFNNDDSRKRARLAFDNLLVSEPIQLPKLPEIDKKKTPSYRPPTNVNALHEPPPNAALLPPIGLEPASSELLGRPNNIRIPDAADIFLGAESSRTPGESDSNTTVSANGTEAAPKKVRRQVRKWTAEETQALMRGVQKHGIGKWKDILEDPECVFSSHRTAIDLKDRFRVCCPESYRARPSNNDVSEYNPRSSSPQEGLRIKGSEATRMKLANLLTQNMGESGPSSTPPPKKINNTKIDKASDDTLAKLGLPEANESDKSASGRRRRRLWTKDEDDNLMLGIRKHGFAWTAMQEDPELHLSHRKATDLRDRIRNMYPEEYKNAGFRPVKSKHISMSMSSVAPTSGQPSDLSNPNNIDTLAKGISTTTTSSTSTTTLTTPKGAQSPALAHRSVPSILSHGNLPSDIQTALPTVSDPPAPTMTVDQLLIHSPTLPPSRDQMLPRFTMFEEAGDLNWDNTLAPLWEDDPI